MMGLPLLAGTVHSRKISVWPRGRAVNIGTLGTLTSVVKLTGIEEYSLAPVALTARTRYTYFTPPGKPVCS